MGRIGWSLVIVFVSALFACQKCVLSSAITGSVSIYFELRLIAFLRRPPNSPPHPLCHPHTRRPSLPTSAAFASSTPCCSAPHSQHRPLHWRSIRRRREWRSQRPVQSRVRERSEKDEHWTCVSIKCSSHSFFTCKKQQNSGSRYHRDFYCL